jgi:flagellar assembly protein FliH
VVYEAPIPFHATVRGVALADPNTPLPVRHPDAKGIPAAEQQAQRAAEVNRQAQQEREAIERILATLTEVAHNLETQQHQRLGEMQQAAVQLAIAVAGRLLQQTIDTGSFPVEALVRKVVERLGPKAPVNVFLHPDDLALLQRRLGENQPLFPDGSAVRVVAEATLKRGDCRAEAGEVSVLSQLEAQLNDLGEHLLGSLADAEIERRKALPGDRNLRRFPDRRQTA